MAQQRYVLKEILGKGGMGAVYRAYDNETRRDITLKTLLDVQDRTMLDLFYRECQVLATLNHPNIVDIYDVGEMEFEGGTRPYFVMPLLPGQTLDKLIAGASHRLTVERIVEILSQAARGLHAAHERGLVHRDVKPSNIFVMEDDSVKIIDFGVAHLADSRTNTTLKGTLHYMAPEQLQLQKPTALSDLFSLAVVAYQTFTRRRPFEGSSMDETIQAILHRIPPPVSDLNAGVSRSISQVVHKAMAKQPWHRFASCREFGDNLQKALRGDAVDAFDDTKILPRVLRARKALDAGEYDFANEVLAGLEAEGYLHSEMASLRRQVDEAIRSRAIRQRLDTARRFMEEEEYQLALTKVQELLQIDPANSDATRLKTEIENRRSSEQVSKWLRLAQQHAENHSYSHARQALENVLQIRPDDVEARKLLSHIMAREQDYLRLRREKDQSYQAAMDAWQRGEVSAALSDMERVLELDKQAPETATPEKAAAYQKFYNQVRSDHDTLQSSYQDARRLVSERNFKQALAVCDSALEKYPGHALFQALRVDIEEQQRHDLSAFIARIDREVEKEPDLERRLSILKQALAAQPGESHFERALQLTTSKRDLVNSIVAKARGYEERGQFQDALAQWEMLRSIYAIYPGLEFEIDRLKKRREQQSRSEAKSGWVRQIEQATASGEFQRAIDLAQTAAVEFPGDAELKALEQLARQGLDKLGEAQRLLEDGKRQCEAGRIAEGLETMRQARSLDENSPQIRAALLDILLRQARALHDSDWRTAGRLTEEALDLEPGNPQAKSLRALFEDHRRAEFVDQCVATARQFQASDNLEQALTAVTGGLTSYPNEPRLQQLKTSLERSMTEIQKTQTRRKDLATVKDLERRAAQVSTPSEIQNLYEQTLHIAGQHKGDRDFEAILGFLQRRMDETTIVVVPPAEVLPPPPPPPPAPPAVAPPVAARPPVPAAPPPPAAAPPAQPPPTAKTPVPPVRPPQPPQAKPAPPQQAKPAPAKAEPKPEPKTAKPVVPPPPPPPPAPPAAARPGGLGKWIAIGAGVAVAIGAAAFFLLRSGGSGNGVTGATGIGIELKTTPPGAALRVDGADVGVSPLQHNLPAGDYTVIARLDGFEPATAKVNVSAARPCCDPIALAPLPGSTHVASDLAGAVVSLDGAPPAPVPTGPGIDFQNIQPGKHTLALTSREGQVSLAFESAAGAAPVAAHPGVPPRTTVFVFTHVGGKGRFWASNAPVRVSFDGGQNFRDVPAEGIAVEGLASGAARELVMEAPNKPPRREAASASDGPTVNLFVYSDRPPQPKGSILLSVNEGDFEVFVDDQKVRAGRAQGGYLIGALSTGKRRVRVAKSGFRAEPESMEVAVADGQTARAAFRLSPAGPTRLVLRNATPGAQVALMSGGGRVLGTTDAQGTITADLAPGEHNLELRRKGYRSRQFAVTVQAGREAELGGARLEIIGAMLAFHNVEPKSGVTLAIQQTAGDIRYEGPNPVRNLPPQITLPAGYYNLTFSAPGFESETISLQLKDYPIEPTVKLRKR